MILVSADIAMRMSLVWLQITRIPHMKVGEQRFHKNMNSPGTFIAVAYPRKTDSFTHIPVAKNSDHTGLRNLNRKREK